MLTRGVGWRPNAGQRETSSLDAVLPQRGVLQAPAKLTLSLRIVGVRQDGYHLIDAEMVSVNLADELHLSPGVGVIYEGLWDGEGHDDDLVTRALAVVGEQRRVRVIKRIPTGAGLGGGSSDAAAILRSSGCTDPEFAAALGADVGFCLAGGRAQVTGIGDCVQALPFRPQVFTLLTPPIHCSTPLVYSAWDAMGKPHGANGNDLEPAALQVAPGLAAACERLRDVTGCQPRLAGSGSTWFVEGAFEGPGLQVVRTIPAI